MAYSNFGILTVVIPINQNKQKNRHTREKRDKVENPTFFSFYYFIFK